MSGGYIYILGSHTGTLYIGVTSNLYLRVIPRPSSAYRRTILFSGFGGRKAPSSMSKISIAGVLRLRATSAVSRD